MSDEKVLVLRTCNADGTSQNDFKWPESGPVEAPDWRDDKKCGGGLHGFLRGEGNGSLANWGLTARWLVVEVLSADVRDLDGKVKFPRGVVIYSGARDVATKMIADRYPGSCVVGGTAAAGDFGTATAGFAGTATAGFAGTATAGDFGTATAGTRGTATAGDFGTATAGTRGTATAGDSGTATAGDSGTATAGDYGTATAGVRGTLTIRYYDAKHDRYRIAVAYVGEDGIEANTAYVLDAEHKFVKKMTQ